MRILVVGFGSVGRKHAANAKVLGHDVFVYDVGKTETEVRAVLPSVSFVNKITDLGVDASVVAVPADRRRDAFASPFGAVPVLVEKPLALDLETALTPSVVQASKAVVLRVGYNLRFHPAYRYVLESVPHLGRIATATFFVHCDKSKWPGSRYESMLFEASHEIDLALWMLGPAVVKGVVKQSDDCWTLLLQHESGASSSVVLDGIHKCGYRRGASIVGENGASTVTWNGPEQKWAWCAIRTGEKLVSGRTSPEDTYLEEMREFLELVKRGIVDDAGVGSTFAEAAAVVSICQEAKDFGGE